MANVYQDRDEAITKAMDEMHARLKNPPRQRLGYTDSQKPSLDYGPLPPATIKGVSESHTRFNIDGPPKK